MTDKVATWRRDRYHKSDVPIHIRRYGMKNLAKICQLLI